MTSTTVTIGSHQVLTGPAASGLNEIAPAAKAYFDYVNARGGVNGRKILYEYLDDAYTPANTPALVRKLVERDQVFAVFNGEGTADHSAVVGYLTAHKVPDLFPASGCVCWNQPSTLPYTFGWQMDYIREGKILGAYVEKAFPGKRIAYFYQDDGYGQQGVQGLERVIPASSVVARQTYKAGYNDVSAQMLAINRSRADVIISFSVPAYTALLRLAQRRTGNTAKLVVSFAGGDPVTLARLLPSQPGGGGADAGVFDGVVTDTWLVPVSQAASGWVALLKEVRDQYLSGQPLDAWTEYGVAAAYTFVQALQRAGRNLTRPSLLTAVAQGGFSPGFGLTPFDYSPTSHGGYTGTQIATIRDGAYVLQRRPVTTDDGSGPVVPYTGPAVPPGPGGVPRP
ncbi:ABC transporter substrate-binding protein [Streptacidiphilus rugosus]|uniref:ABC transporter substrate-binding protein n=1 Tax=Streptacidiphilus rugosus TaxID=405783 RepID=UPI001E3D8073|nr:ABC transporter substrate-binding protein [Streptacidiphilus rugosus]